MDWESSQNSSFWIWIIFILAWYPNFLVVYSCFDCEVLLQLSMTFLLGMVCYWYFEPQQSQMRFYLIHGRHLSGRFQCSHRATTATQATMSSDNPIYHERHLLGRVQCSHRATAMPNIVTGALPTISIMRPGNPIYDLLYEFKLHCHLLLGNVSHHFDNNGFRSRETVNIKYCINNSGIWGPTRHLPLKNN